jgi:BlaI family transcriptional regulator, penicillinase repressor
MKDRDKEKMARKKNPEQLTPLELEIMKVLWELGDGSVQEVQQRLPNNEQKLAYTTVQTMLNVLYKKGKVKRVLKDRAYIYKPIVSRLKVVSQAMSDIIERLFGGSAENLVISLVETQHLTPEKLAELNKLVDHAQENKAQQEKKDEQR